ncbi:hypothetical protein ADIS_2098 [Lunatimonas lonarensis]|uniref:Uncharacterized protein n=1 Tax=Lunatimonas lonarensis TaxID=1232681 RepID=R7ZTN8_9BACT|nr:hypothetical protein ADIS_2098 [Lunatimonas lonarensis]
MADWEKTLKMGKNKNVNRTEISLQAGFMVILGKNLVKSDGSES